MDTLGIDIGNVIIDNRVPVYKDGVEIDYHTEYALAPSLPGVIEALQRLRTEKFGDNIHIVSRATPVQAENNLRWLNENGFFEKTGVSRDNLHFCLERHEKAPYCRTHGVTHFVDDHPEVLSHMLEDVPHLFALRPFEEEVTQFKELFPRIHRVESWDEIVRAIL